MAREVRNADVIGKTGVYLKNTCQELSNLKSAFIADIDNIANTYKGSDATAIVNLLIAAINKIDGLINNFNYYSEYMLAIAKFDNENISNINKKIQKKNMLQSNFNKGELLNGSEKIND